MPPPLIVFGALLAPALLGLAGLCRVLALGLALLAGVLSAVSSLLRSLVVIGSGLDAILFGAVFALLLFFWPLLDLVRLLLYVAYLGEGAERVSDAISNPCFLPFGDFLGLRFLGFDFPALWQQWTQDSLALALVGAAGSLCLTSVVAGVRFWFVYTLPFWCWVRPSSLSCSCLQFE